MSFTTDATSLIGIPQNATEWGDSSLSSDIAVPDSLYLCQELSGNLTDTIGGRTLTKSGLPVYSKAVTGWTTKGIDVSGNGALGSSQGFTSADHFFDPTANSYLVLMYVNFVTATTTVKWAGAALGGGSQTVRCVASTTPRYGVGIANVQSDVFGTTSPIGGSTTMKAGPRGSYQTPS